MDYGTLREYCLAKPGTDEGLPFGPDTLVLKVGGKMFALMGLENVVNPTINLKCDPEYAQELRERYPNTVLPGYHMNKKHWNTVVLHGQLTTQAIYELIDHSYQLVFDSLPAKVRAELQ